MFVSNIPAPSEISRIYSSPDYYNLPRESVQRIESEARRRIETLVADGAMGSFMDIGCAKGWQLDEARARGFETHGSDLSWENVKHCRENHHNVFYGDLSGFVAFNGDTRFGVVSCLDVLEHVDYPLEFLKAARSVLSDEGTMVVSVPNYSGIVARLLGDRDPYLIPPEHLNFFTQSGMEKLFEAAKLIVLKRVTFGVLTREESRRVAGKYFPSPFDRLGSAIQAVISIGVPALNLIGAGLEQEFYLAREK